MQIASAHTQGYETPAQDPQVSPGTAGFMGPQSLAHWAPGPHAPPYILLPPDTGNTFSLVPGHRVLGPPAPAPACSLGTDFQGCKLRGSGFWAEAYVLWAENRKSDGDGPSSHEAGSHGVFPDRSQVVVFTQKAEEESSGETPMPHTETGCRKAE